RWSLRLPARSLLGGQALTADGGLAMVVSGQGIQVVNLTDGRVRWQRRIAASPALTAAGGVVIYGLNGHLTGHDARTGRPRWVSAPGMSPDPGAQASVLSAGPGGLAVATYDPRR